MSNHMHSSPRDHRIRTGIYGGTFNPIHIGHIRLGEWLCLKEEVDELWYMVSPLNPFKVGSEQDILPDETRLRLVNIAVSDNPHLSASDFEMHLPIPSFMVHTLEELRKACPDREFILVIGADNWVRFPQWRDSEKILYNHHIIVYPRTGYPVNRTTLPPNVKYVDAPLFDISSTDIRKAIAEGTCNGEWLSPAVWEEIKSKGFYSSK